MTKSGRGGGGETAVCRRALWNQAYGTESQAERAHAARNCRGPARRETDSPAASQTLSGSQDSILPWMMCAGPSPSLSHCGTRTSSIASYSKPLHPPHSRAPSITSCQLLFFHLLGVWANRAAAPETEEGLWLCQWKCHYKRVTEVIMNSAAVALQSISCGQTSLQENPRANFSNSKVKELPFIEYADTCKAYGSKIYITQPKAGTEEV